MGLTSGKIWSQPGEAGLRFPIPAPQAGPCPSGHSFAAVSETGLPVSTSNSPPGSGRKEDAAKLNGWHKLLQADVRRPTFWGTVRNNLGPPYLAAMDFFKPAPWEQGKRQV